MSRSIRAVAFCKSNPCRKVGSINPATGGKTIDEDDGRYTVAAGIAWVNNMATQAWTIPPGDRYARQRHSIRIGVRQGSGRRVFGVEAILARLRTGHDLLTMPAEGGFQVTSLAGKKALVCGGSQGIGRACAMELARAGASITIVARNEQALEKTVCELPGDVPHRWIAADFSEPDEVREKVVLHVQEFGPLTILVNNTGGPPHGAMVDATPEQFLGAIKNHVVCNQLLAQALLRGMKGARYGRIINIISTSVLMPIRGLGVSNTTRGAVANWGRTMAGELAPLGITVNNVLPGFTDTSRLKSLFEAKAEKLGTTPDQVRKNVIASIPMERMANPSEIGAVVAFLASPAASYVSGVNLPVDGARTAIQ